MTTLRYDKNGIRILDDPKDANKLPKTTPCAAPPMHRWRPTGRYDVDYDDSGFPYRTHETTRELRCTICGATRWD